MQLVYKDTSKPVKVGDIFRLHNGENAEVHFFRPPHKASSEGKVTMRFNDDDHMIEYNVSVIGAEWINREDREPE